MMKRKQVWSDKHEQLCERLVKGQPFFEKLWEMENEQKGKLKNRQLAVF